MSALDKIKNGASTLKVVGVAVVTSVVALATTAQQTFAAVTVDSSGSITVPQADVDAQGGAMVNTGASMLTLLFQYGKWLVIIAGIYLFLRYAKKFFGQK